MRADRGRPGESARPPDTLVSRLAEHAIAVRPGTALGIPARSGSACPPSAA